MQKSQPLRQNAQFNEPQFFPSMFFSFPFVVFRLAFVFGVEYLFILFFVSSVLSAFIYRTKNIRNWQICVFFLSGLWVCAECVDAVVVCFVVVFFSVEIFNSSQFVFNNGLYTFFSLFVQLIFSIRSELDGNRLGRFFLCSITKN